MRNQFILILALLATTTLFIWACNEDKTEIKPGGGDADTDTDSDSDSDGDDDDDNNNNDDNNDDDNNNDNDDNNEDDAGCHEIDWKMERDPINMLVLVDRSASMKETLPDSTLSYADAVADALKAVVEQNIVQKRINFGLGVFPSMSCEPDADIPNGDLDTPCRPAAWDAVDPGFGNPVVPIVDSNETQQAQIEAIRNQLDTIGQCGGTPVCESLKWAYEYLTGNNAMSEDPHNQTPAFPENLKDYPSYVLLATDGAPNCNPAGDMSSCEHSSTPGDDIHSPEECLDKLCSLNAAQKLASMGIKTFVVGVGSEVAQFEDVLNEIADAGGTGEYFSANDPQTLNEQFIQITGDISNCDFKLVWEEVPDIVDGESLEKGCQEVGLISRSAAGDIDMAYSPSCTGEDGDTGIFAWRWKEFPGVLMNDLPNNEDEVDQCKTVELCPDACEKWRTFQWEQLVGEFGCFQIIVD